MSVIVSYIRSVAGDAGVARLLELAGETRSVEEIAATTAWSSYDQANALMGAAREITGDGLVGRRIGETLLRQHAGTEVAALLRSLGSPREVLRNIAETAAKYSTVTTMTPIELHDGDALVEARTAAPIIRSRYFCDYTAGVLSQAAPLFGLDDADVDELECQTRGDGRCLYRVRWVDHGDAAQQVEHLRMQLALLTNRFEQLQATAATLMSSNDVDEVLTAVTSRAGSAVRAPQFVLAVELRGDRVPRVHSDGFASEAEARGAADAFLRGASPADGVSLVVPVETSRRRFGVLAAMFPTGYRFFPQERDLLAAYAGQAAAALEAAEALEEARRQNETSRALFHLAQSLAQVSTRGELAAELVTTGRRLVNGDVASVMLWDEEALGLRMHALEGFAPDTAMFLDGLVIREADTPALEAMLRDPAPLLFDLTTDDDFLRTLLLVSAVAQAAVVPLVARGELLGIVSVGFADPPTSTDDLIERLAGIASCAATSAENVRLLESVKHQATHDPLTGLVNARGLGDRATAVFDGATAPSTAVGVLFVDLDHFKPINDTYGHEAGDQVLREVARRLAGATRSGDIVARIGGDEFVVLLPSTTGPAEVEAVAERVERAVAGAYQLGATTVYLGASVGAATVDDPANVGLRDLLRMADAAMYEQKLERRSVDSISGR